MQAQSISLLNDIFEDSKSRLIIPVYQRNYDWKVENVRRLLDDIGDILGTSKMHFFGVIVYKPQNVQIKSREFLIIDGQQRLTTITLLLLALKDILEDKESLSNQINSYLTYDNGNEDFELKLKPIKSDNDQYQALLNHKTDSIDQENNMYRNYVAAKERFKEWIDNGTEPEEILNAIGRLQVVGISLNSEDDDPQLIFESINSTGVPLTNSDLIRNYLLISENDQDRLFRKYWVSIELALQVNNSSKELNDFFRQLMIMNYGPRVTNPRVYHYFVKYCEDNFNHDHEKALKTILSFAKIYQAFIKPYQSNYNAKVQKWLAALATIQQTTCYPFLMLVFKDYENHVIDEETLTRVVRLIAVYLIRRTICEVQTNTLRGFFASLYNQVFKISDNKKYYYAALNKFLFTRQNIDAIPSDTNVENALEYGQLYHNKKLCGLLLQDIENGTSNEKLDISNLTIEHIMPQTLGAGWNILTEDHDKYVHTLGNLSLTGYNSTMSNKSFADKKKILSKYTKVKVLNQDVLDKKDWTVDDIKLRTQRLTQILINQYSIAAVNAPDIEFEHYDRLPVDDPTAGTNRKPVGFILNDRRYRATSFRKVAAGLALELDRLKPDLLPKLVEKHGRINGRAIYINNTQHKDIHGHFAPLKGNIYVQNGGSAWEIMRMLKKLLEYYDVPLDQFRVLVRIKK